MTKTVRPTTIFRGFLTVGHDCNVPVTPQSSEEPSLLIPIWIYNRTMSEKIPSAKKYSTVSQTSTSVGEDAKTMMVEMDRKYTLVDETQAEVSQDSLVKAYKYGKNLIPFYQLDEEVMRLTSIKGMWVLGFILEKDASVFFVGL
jgi:hypothetical protein